MRGAMAVMLGNEQVLPSPLKFILAVGRAQTAGDGRQALGRLHAHLGLAAAVPHPVAAVAPRHAQREVIGIGA